MWKDVDKLDLQKKNVDNSSCQNYTFPIFSYDFALFCSHEGEDVTTEKYNFV